MICVVLLFFHFVARFIKSFAKGGWIDKMAGDFAFLVSLRRIFDLAVFF